MTIESEKLASCLLSRGVTRLVGVPDSVLSGFCVTAAEVFGEDRHVVAANEGGAVAHAIGHNLATGEISAVYMQNSGLGNAINPLVSLASPEVYSIPMVLIIGWRAMPGTKDEPQHVHQGRITESILDSLDIPYRVVCSDDGEIDDMVDELVDVAKSQSTPVAILVPKGSLKSQIEPKRCLSETLMSREEALRVALGAIDPKVRIVSTTGMLSRELYENTNQLLDVRAFMTVGGMGHASTIALGVAASLDGAPVVCLDGDGAALMHLGSLVAIGKQAPAGFVHILFNNGVHDSVGGQETVGPDFDFTEFAKMCGYSFSRRVSSAVEIEQAVTEARESSGTSFVEILVNPGNREGIGRPKEAMTSLKPRFMGS